MQLPGRLGSPAGPQNLQQFFQLPCKPSRQADGAVTDWVHLSADFRGGSLLARFPAVQLSDKRSQGFVVGFIFVAVIVTIRVTSSKFLTFCCLCRIFSPQVVGKAAGMHQVGTGWKEDEEMGVPTSLPLRSTSTGPDPQAMALRLANELLSQKVWEFSKGSFRLGPGAFRPFKRGFSVRCYLWDLWWLSKLMFWRLISQVWNLKVGVPRVEFKPFTPQGEAPGFEILPDCELLLFTTIVL